MSNENELPIGWAEVPLGIVSTLINGDRGKNYPSQSAFVEKGIPFINAGHLVKGQIDFADMNYISAERFDLLGSGKVCQDDVLYCLRGSLGKSAVVNGIEHGAIASSLVIVRAKEACIPKYLYFFLVSPFGQHEIARYDNGSAQPNLSAASVKAYKVPVAPYNEQRRIVARIEELFSNLDAGVAALERAKANLKRYRAAVLKAAVEGKLTADWRAKHPKTEPASKLLERILVERRKKWEADQLAKFAAAGKEPPKNWKAKYHEPASPAEVVLPDVPVGWTISSLEQLTSEVRPICYGILMPKEHVEGGVLYVKVKDMKGDQIDVSSLNRTKHSIAAQYARASLKENDLLLAIRGTYGRVAVVPPELDGGNTTQDTARLATSDLVDLQFVALHLRSLDSQNYFKRVARGVAVKGVNIGDVRPCPILLPSLNEQKQIVAEAEERLSQITAAEQRIEASLLRAARLRQSILKQAFEGKLVPQYPEDESADVLLTKLRSAAATTPSANGASNRLSRKKAGAPR